MSPLRRIYILTVVLSVAGLAGCLVLGWGGPPWWALPATACAVAVGEIATARLAVGNESGIAFSLGDAVVAVGFVLDPGAWVAVAILVAVVVANSRSEPIKVAFNGAQYLATLCGGLLVAVALGGGIGAATLGLGVFGVANGLIVALPISWTSGRRYLEVVIRTGGMTFIHLAGNLSLGLLAAWLAAHRPLGLLGLAAPLVLLWWSYQQQTERASEAKLFAELARGQERATSRSLDSSAQVIVTAAARLFASTEVEILLRHPEGLVRYVGNEGGISRRQRVEAEAFAEPWVLRAMGARGVRLGTEDGRPYCSAVLGDFDRPLAVLIVRRKVKAKPFERLDARLANVLVGQAEGWLSVAELTDRQGPPSADGVREGDAGRATGSLSAQTAPSLVVLRESAERLSRLASSFAGPDPVREIVDELHAAERAVASLLGAVALASEPDPMGGSSEAARLRRSMRVDSEWTTTGRLEASEVS